MTSTSGVPVNYTTSGSGDGFGGGGWMGFFAGILAGGLFNRGGLDGGTSGAAAAVLSGEINQIQNAVGGVGRDVLISNSALAGEINTNTIATIQGQNTTNLALATGLGDAKVTTLLEGQAIKNLIVAESGITNNNINCGFRTTDNLIISGQFANEKGFCATNGNIDRLRYDNSLSFANLQHNMDMGFCKTNANVVEQGNLTRSEVLGWLNNDRFIRDQREISDLKDALRDERADHRHSRDINFISERITQIGTGNVNTGSNTAAQLPALAI